MNEFRFGQGKISATFCIFLGVLSLGGVICFYFPEFFSSGELRDMYPLNIIRFLINAFICLSVTFGILSLFLGYNAQIPLGGMSASLIAALLGGGSVEVGDFESGLVSMGLDWFLLDILILAVIFIPLEKIWPLKKDQKLFRDDLKLDLIYFASNHLLFQGLLFFSSIPARILENAFGKWTVGDKIHHLPFLFQLFLVFLILDLFQYFTHRAFHKFRFLWKFHAIHHSITEVDWIAGSRLHIVDVLLTRAIIFIPIHLAGFRQDVLEVYIVITAFQTVLIHSNLGLNLNRLRYFTVTPSYHHWHHASDLEALDKNFAVHLPFIDLLFGTFYHPKDKWPKGYGLYKEKIPDGFIQQTLYPFK